MKKVTILAIALMTFVGVAQAQYKPAKGTFSTELNFSPFGNVGENFSLPELGIKGRYFFADNLALRASLNFGYLSQNDHEFTPPGTTPEVERTSANSVTTFSLAPGIEYHFGNWEKTSLYCGAEIGFNLNSASSSVENAGFISGNKIETSGFSEIDGNDYFSGFGFGFNIVTGFDHYFTQSLYVGAEIGLGFRTFSSDGVETTTSGVTVERKDYMSQTGFGFYCNPAIRLGWKF